MSVLYLDIDGVLNDEDWFATEDRLALRGLPVPYPDDIRPRYVARVRGIVSRTGCRVVLCSAWALDPEARDVAVKRLAQLGVIVHGATIDNYRRKMSDYQWRGNAIRADVATHDEPWCWLDDEADSKLPQSVRVVDGLTAEDVERVVGILGCHRLSRSGDNGPGVG